MNLWSSNRPVLFVMRLRGSFAGWVVCCIRCALRGSNIELFSHRGGLNDERCR